MNEVYAIDPGCTSELGQLQHLLQQFGFASGRFIAKYPSRWRSMVAERFESLGDVAKERLKRQLQLAEEASFDFGCDYLESRPWLDNAVGTLLRKHPVASLILENDHPPAGVSIERVLYEPRFGLRDGRGAHIARTPDSYASCVWPLLSRSREVYVVDRFFRLRYSPKDGSAPRLDRRRAEVLTKFLHAAHRSHRCKKLIVIAEAGPVLQYGGSPQDWLEDLAYVQRDANAEGVSLEGRLLPSVEHGRYIFSSKAGLQFDWGFDLNMDPQAEKNHVHWLSPGELDPIFDRYASHWLG